MNTTEMKRYKSAEWNFALDIRFASKEEGNHLVIIFRGPRDPQRPLKESCV
jgi:hypothetical protein